VTVSSTEAPPSVGIDAAEALSSLYGVDVNVGGPLCLPRAESPWSVRFDDTLRTFHVELPDIYLSVKGEEKDLVVMAGDPLDAVRETFDQLKQICRDGGVILIKRRMGAVRVRWFEFCSVTGERLDRPGWWVVTS